jgi:hypothetical protein
VGPLKIPDGLADEQVLFLSDILPTGFMAAENCDIQPGDTVTVWGCGPVGQLAIISARMLGAEQIIAIDGYSERLVMAAAHGRALTINYRRENVLDRLTDLTGGRGPDTCIDAVGLEAHGTSIDNLYDWVKQYLFLETDRPHVLRLAIQACRKGGHAFHPWGVRWLHRQGGFRRRLRQGAEVQDGPNSCPQVHAAPFGIHPQGQPGPVLCHYPPVTVGPGAGRVPHLQQEGKQLHQSRYEALNYLKDRITPSASEGATFRRGGTPVRQTEPKPPFPEQHQERPGLEARVDPRPHYGRRSTKVPASSKARSP